MEDVDEEAEEEEKDNEDFALVTEEEDDENSFRVKNLKINQEDTLEGIVAQTMTESLDELLAFEASETLLDHAIAGASSLGGGTADSSSMSSYKKGKNMDLKARLAEQMDRLNQKTELACVELLRDRLLSKSLWNLYKCA